MHFYSLWLYFTNVYFKHKKACINYADFYSFIDSFYPSARCKLRNNLKPNNERT